MIELVDTHCHIQSIGAAQGEPITRELWTKAKLTADEIISEAVKADVTKLLCVGCDLQDSQLAIDFVRNRPACWATIGIHPHEAKPAIDKGQLAPFAGLVDQPKVVAVGECGLDYYYEHSPKAQQEEVLKFQIELALDAGLPLIFHVREAFNDFWPIFDSYQGIRGVLHSFTDSADNLAKALDSGLYLGVNGIATFAKNPAQLEVYRTIPLEKLLLETDAPFLTPTPYRGTINEPKHTGTIGKFLAELRSEDFAHLADTTTRNARQLFGI